MGIAFCVLQGCGQVFPTETVEVGQSPSLAPVIAVSEQVVEKRAVPFVRPFMIDADEFLDAATLPGLMAQAKERTELSVRCTEYRGGIVNHHALAADIIARFFYELGRCRPDVETVIVLSPDHYHAGHAPLVTHHVPYLTQGDEVNVATSSIARLLAAVPATRVNMVPFLREHGIGALVPFLHQALPQAAVIPVAIEGRITEAEGRRVAAWLTEELKDRKTIVIVSSDMSHYLREEIAQKNDRATRAALQQGNGQFFFRNADDYTDNGKSIWIVLQALKPRAWHELDAKSSTEYGTSPLDTTTYITGYWSR